MISTRALLILAPLAAASPALAQGTPEQRIACGPEAFRLCRSAIPNVEKVTACMREKRSELNEACRTAMDAAGPAQQTQTAEAPPAPVPTQPEERPVDQPKAAEAAPVAPPPVQQAKAARPPLRFETRKEARSDRAVRRVASRRLRRDGADRDTAEALYWMRRVTGYSGPINVSAFQPQSFAKFAAQFGG